MARDSSVSWSPVVTLGQIKVSFVIAVTALGGFVYVVMNEAVEIKFQAREISHDYSKN